MDVRVRGSQALEHGGVLARGLGEASGLASTAVLAWNRAELELRPESGESDPRCPRLGTHSMAVRLGARERAKEVASELR